MAATSRPLRRPSRWVKFIILASVALAACAIHAEDATRAQAGESTTELADQSGSVAKNSVPEFVPTDEWQDILPGQSIPPGLHVRLNLATGKREAKLMSDDEVINEDPNVITRDVTIDKGAEASVTVTTDITGDVQDATLHSGPSHALAVVEEDERSTEESTKVSTTAAETEHPQESEGEDEAPPAREPNWNHEKIYEVLQQLPEPPQVDGMDIHEAHAKLSTPEFRRKMIALWKKRQEELKEAIDTMQDDAKYLAKLLDQFKEAEKNGDTDGQLNVLEVIEWEVQDLDKTHVFNFIGGFNVIADYLNSTNLPVRAHASWLIGTAVKNYKDGQDWAINAGAIPKLVSSIALPLAQDDDSTRRSHVFEVKKKALYGLSSLVRFNPRGQRLLLALEGPEKLSTLMADDHPLGVQLKAVLFAHDLLLEEQSETVTQDSAALQYLQGAFRSPAWCKHTAKFIIQNNAKIQRNQVVETLQAMEAQLPQCQETFADASVRDTVQSIHTSWSTDSTLDDDEREDLVLVASSLLSKL